MKGLRRFWVAALGSAAGIGLLAGGVWVAPGDSFFWRRSAENDGEAEREEPPEEPLEEELPPTGREGGSLWMRGAPLPSPGFGGMGEPVKPARPAAVFRREPVSAAEPTIQQVHRMAIAYAELGPEKIRRWRGLARWRSFIPSFTLGLDQDRDANIVSSTTGGVTKFSVGPDRRTRSLDFGFSWDLADLVWSPDQTSIDVRSRLTTQLRQDILEEATRLYFERRRLRAEFAGQPTEDAALREERRLRVEELTAYLDALTGGGFSRQPD